MREPGHLSLDDLAADGCKIVAFSGRIGAGKSTISERVSAALGLELLRSRKYLERTLESLGIEANERNMQAIGRFFVSTVGGDGLTLRVLSMRAANAVAYDSFRNLSEAQLFKRSLGNSFQLIFLDVSDDTRLARFMGRTVRENDREAFDRREAHVVEEEVPSLKGVADFVMQEAEIETTVSAICAHLRMAWGEPNA